MTATQYDHGARTFNDRVEFDPSLNIGGSYGYDFGFARIEGELAYKRGEISSINDQTSQVKYANVDGGVGVYSMMGNVFFDLRNPSPVTPYIGGGIGLATLYLDDTYATNPSTGHRDEALRVRLEHRIRLPGRSRSGDRLKQQAFAGSWIPLLRHCKDNLQQELEHNDGDGVQEPQRIGGVKVEMVKF